MNPNNWYTAWSFIAVATLLSISCGWSIKSNRLPIKSTLPFSDRQLKFMKVWVNVALLIGVIVPIMMLVIFWHRPIARQFFSCYLLVVAIQLGCETVFSRILCNSIVVIIGTLYTGFRIWQLWEGLQLTTYSQPWLSLLWLVFFFWVANMIMLTTLAIPSIISKNLYKQGYTE
jgi:hypothetical protein